MFKSNENHFELNGTIERETEKAILVSFFELSAPVWMPKSQIKVVDGVIFANDWIVREKFGDKLYIKMMEARTEAKRAEERRKDFEKNGRDLGVVKFGTSRAVATEFADRFVIVVRSDDHYGYDNENNADIKTLTALGFTSKTVLVHDDQYAIFVRRFDTVEEMMSVLESLDTAVEAKVEVAAETKVETVVAPVCDMDRSKVKDMNEVIVRFESDTNEWTVRGTTGKLKGRLFARMFVEGSWWVIEKNGVVLGSWKEERSGHRKLLEYAGDIADDILCQVIR